MLYLRLLFLQIVGVENLGNAEKDAVIPTIDAESRNIPSNRRKKTIIAITIVTILIASSFYALFLYSQEPSADTIIDDRVRLPENDARIVNVTVLNGSVVYEYSSAPDKLNYSVGDIIVGTTGMGYLRRITGIEQTGSEVKLLTENASLEDVIKKGEINFEKNLTSAMIQTESLASTSSLAETNSQFTLYEFDIDFEKDFTVDGVSVSIIGSASFDINLIMEARYDWFKGLQRVYFAAQTITKFSLGITASKAIDYSKEITLFDHYFPTFTITVGGIPILLTPRMSVLVGLDAALEGSLTASIQGNITTESGVKYENGAWSPVNDATHSIDYQTPTLSGSCEAEVYSIIPRLQLLIYGVVGPYFELRPYLSFDAEASITVSQTTLSWNLDAGLKGTAGIEIAVFGRTIADYSDEIFDLKWDISQGNVVIATSTVPSAPQNLQATVGNAQVSLSWSAPSSNGGTTITGYKVFRGTSSGGESYLITVTGLSYTNTGLTNGQTYYYQVCAVSAVGDGPNSNEVSATPFLSNTVPTAPQNLVAVAGDRLTNLSWQVPMSDGGSPITNYRIYRGTSSGNEVLLIQIGNTLSYTDSSLTNGIEYYYEVSAVNVIGEGAKSNEESAIPTSVIYLPHAPILIIGNANFTNASGVTWGSGIASDPYVIRGWNINASTANGIDIQSTNAYFIVRDCYIHDGGISYHYGIYLSNCVSGVLSNNTCSNNYYGIYLVYYSSNNTVSNNNCSSNDEYGICLDGSCNGNALINNTCSNNYYDGIALGYSSNNTVSNNTCDSNILDGIYLYSSSNTTINNNNCSNNYDGISIDSLSNGNALINNTCSNNYYDGIALGSSSDNNILSDNNCSNNGYGIYLGSSNDNNILSGNTCSNNVWRGICLESSSGNTLSNNTCSSNGWDGIYLGYSNDNNILSGNTCSNNGYGIYLGSSNDNNILSGNTCSNNDYGIILDTYGNSNTLSNNTCSSNNQYGIYLYSSDSNTLSGNNCSSNTQQGIYLESASDNNIISGNELCNNNGAGDTYNPAHIQAYDAGTNNRWNSSSGYGNYWSDWTTPDGNSDGIVDNPYVTAGSAASRDWYPLTTPP